MAALNAATGKPVPETEPPTRAVANLRGNDADLIDSYGRVTQNGNPENDVPQACLLEYPPLLPIFASVRRFKTLLKLNPSNSSKVGNQQGANPGGTSIDAFSRLFAILAAMGALYHLVVQIRKSRFVTHKDN